MDSIIISSIIESMPIGLMVIDPTGRIIVTNGALAAILGLDREFIASKGWGELFISEENNLDFNQVLIDVIFKEIIDLRRTVPYTRPDGSQLQLSITSSYLSVDAKLIGIVLLMEDVTEKTLLYNREKAILTAMHNLQQERMEGLHKLSLSVAHQIRNPIATIGGFANMLVRSTHCGAAASEPLEIILSELSKLENVVRAVRQYASIPNARPVPVPARKLIDDAVDKLTERAASLMQTVMITRRIPALILAVDPIMFAQVLDSVLLNSLEAGAESPTIAIAIRLDAGQDDIRLVIEDNGMGIIEENQPFIFDPFFTTKAQAVGMGLCLAKRIILEHRGEIHVHSQAGHGCQVEIVLPAQPPDVA